MIPCKFPHWDDLPLRVQLWRNATARLPGHRMHVSPDWHNVRIEATVRNRLRIHMFEAARRKRVQVYLNKQAKRAARGRLSMVG